MNVTTATALEKRIKRHIIGRKRTYFVATAPGLESVCAKQLHRACPNATETGITSGGVEFVGRLDDCYLANLHLRCANRVLLRMDEIKATTFEQLERGLTRIDWELYLVPGTNIEVNATSRRCRLYHSGAIAERVANVVNASLGRSSCGADIEKPTQTIFIRGVGNRFTVSLDSSGEHLHKRGLKKDVGTAPIRETLAAAILHWAGYSDRVPLLDPMCGSGTFATEAAMMASDIPPGFFREFAFMGWPSFRIKRWEYLKKEASGHMRPDHRPWIHASDIDEKACARLAATVSNSPIASAITIRRTDFFSLDPRKFDHGPGLVVLNPPYGRRLGPSENCLQNYQAIARRLKELYSGWKFALLVPGNHIAAGLPLRATQRSLLHGGLRLTLLMGVITKNHGGHRESS